jgi:hypothetical protein
MIIDLKLEPFHHLIIDDFYTPEEHTRALNEVQGYINQDLFKGPEETHSAAVITRDNYKEDIHYLKKNTGLFLEPDKHPNSFIANHFAMFSQEYNKNFTQGLENRSWFFSVPLPNGWSSLISYYSKSDYYSPHHDVSTMTFLTWINKEPKKFTGGDLLFPQFDYSIEYKNNRSVCFFSLLKHGVSAVEMDGEEGEIGGRIAIAHLMQETA